MPRTEPAEPADQGGLPFEWAGLDPEIAWTEALGASSGPDGSGEYSAACPAHDDHSPSLRWKVTGDGRILFHCHAGCDYGSVLKALGLGPWDLQRPTTRYEYRDRVGNPVFRVVRTQTTGGKQFRQEHYDPSGRWLPGRGGTPDLVWRLDQALAWAAGGPDGRLWLCEGERDAIALASRIEPGDFATTGPGGASKWSDDLTSQVVEIVSAAGGAIVRLVGDADTAGTNRVLSLRSALESAGLTVEACTADPSVGKDVAELIDRDPANWRRHLLEMTDDPTERPMGPTGGSYLAAAPEGRGRALYCLVQRGQRMEPSLRWHASALPLARVVSDEGIVQGWLAEYREPGRDPRAVYFPAEQMTSKSRFSEFLARNGLAAPYPGSSSDLHDLVRSFLAHHGESAPVARALPKTGWNAHGDGTWTLVSHDGRSLMGPPGVRIRRARDTGMHLGTVDPQEAADRVAEALTFRDMSEAGPLMAWSAMVALQPTWTALGYAICPSLAVYGVQGSSKTNSPYLGFAGLVRPSTVTGSGAGLRQQFHRDSGVWIDDDEITPGNREVIRQVATGSAHSSGTVDGEGRADRMFGWFAYSAEGSTGAADAARDVRTVVVRLTTNPGSRTLPDGTPQWARASLFCPRPGGSPNLASEAAGTLAVELNRVASQMRLPVASGKRDLYRQEMMRATSRVVAEWLAEAGHGPIGQQMVQAVEHWCEQEDRMSRYRSDGGGQILVDTLLPLYLGWAESSMLGPWHLAMGPGADLDDPSQVSSTITASYHQTPRNALGLIAPPVIVVTSGERVSVLVNSGLLAVWAGHRDGGQKYEEIRSARPSMLSRSGLGTQVAQCRKNPWWGAPGHSGRVSVGGRQIRYSALSGDLSRIVLDAVSE
jgi:hypothetical protein